MKRFLRHILSGAVLALGLFLTALPVLAQTGSVRQFTGQWISAAGEDAWGLTVLQNFPSNPNYVFVPWYTYDSSGKASWYIFQSDSLSADNSITADVYRYTGSPWGTMPFDNSRIADNKVGMAVLKFNSPTSATFSYDVEDATRSIELTKLDGASNRIGRYTGQWISAAGEDAWGLTVLQNFPSNPDYVFVPWYTYNSSGEASWYIFQSDSLSADNSVTADVYRYTGSPWGTMPFDNSQIADNKVGTATLKFASPTSATFSYNVENASRTIPLTRLDGAPDCEIVQTSSTVAVGTPVVLMASCDETPASYQWTGVGMAESCARTGICSATAKAAGQATYALTTQKRDGSFSVAVHTLNWAPATTPPVGGNAAPECYALLADDAAPIMGQTITLTASCAGAESYTWEGTGLSEGCTGRICTAAPTNAGSYTYTVTAHNSSVTGKAAGGGNSTSAEVNYKTGIVDPAAEYGCEISVNNKNKDDIKPEDILINYVKVNSKPTLSVTCKNFSFSLEDVVSLGWKSSIAHTGTKLCIGATDNRYILNDKCTVTNDKVEPATYTVSKGSMELAQKRLYWVLDPHNPAPPPAPKCDLTIPDRKVPIMGGNVTLEMKCNPEATTYSWEARLGGSNMMPVDRCFGLSKCTFISPLLSSLAGEDFYKVTANNGGWATYSINWQSPPKVTCTITSLPGSEPLKQRINNAIKLDASCVNSTNGVRVEPRLYVWEGHGIGNRCDGSAGCEVNSEVPGYGMYSVRVPGDGNTRGWGQINWFDPNPTTYTVTTETRLGKGSFDPPFARVTSGGVYFEIKADNGYSIGTIASDCGRETLTSGDVYKSNYLYFTGPITKNCRVAVLFKNAYTVTPTGSNKKSGEALVLITPSTTVVVPEEAQQEFIIRSSNSGYTPHVGGTCGGWWVDRLSGRYSTDLVTKNCTVEVTLLPINPTDPTVTAPTGCSILPPGAQSAPSTGWPMNLTASCTGNTTGSTTYNWTRTGGTAGTQSSTGATWANTLPTNTTTSPITYTYTMRACNGTACASNATKTVTVEAANGSTPSQPNCTITASPSSPVAGSWLTLTSSCTNNPTSYQWSGTGIHGSCETQYQCGAQVAGISQNTTITYTLKATNAAGTSTTTKSVTWTAASGPPPTPPTGCTASVSPASLSSSGGAVSLTASCASNATGSTTYSWTRNPTSGGFPKIGASVSDALPANTSTSSVMYTYTMTACNGTACAAAVTRTVTVAAAVPGGSSVTSVTSTNSSYSGASVTPQVNVTAYFRVLGSNMPATLAFALDDCENVQPISRDATEARFQCVPRGSGGTKNVTVKNQSGGTTLHTSSIYVNAAATTAPTGCSTSASPASLPSSGGSVSLTASCSGNTTGSTMYSWTRTGGSGGTVNYNGSSISNSLPANNTTLPIAYTYTMRACNGADCAANVTRTVTVAAASSVSAPTCSNLYMSGTFSPVVGTTITLTAECSGATSYTWSGTGLSSGCTGHTCTATSTTAGSRTYTVVANNAGGSSTPISITANWTAAALTPTCSSIGTSALSPVVGTTITLTASCSNAMFYTWTRSGVGSVGSGCGSTCTATSTTVGSSTYTVTAQNAAGYSTPVTRTINWVAPPITPSVTNVTSMNSSFTTTVTPKVNQLAYFRVTGSNLPTTLAFALDHCENVYFSWRDSGNEAGFQCTPRASGNWMITVKDKAGGTSLYNRSIYVSP